MATVDERIVEMRFNRADFLRGTEETLNSLQRLEAALGGTGGISESLNKIASGFTEPVKSASVYSVRSVLWLWRWVRRSLPMSWTR